MEAKLLGQDGDTRLLHVTCRKCHHTILTLVLVNKVGASSVGILTDLSYEDVLRFQANKAVTVNDVIDVHGWLEPPKRRKKTPTPSRSRVKRMGS